MTVTALIGNQQCFSGYMFSRGVRFFSWLLEPWLLIRASWAALAFGNLVSVANIKLSCSAREGAWRMCFLDHIERLIALLWYLGIVGSALPA